MSRDSKATLIDQLGHMIVRWQDATQKYDEAIGEIYGLSATERLCLSFLWPGPQTASAIAREIRLTPAAVTALVDRLESRGYVRRTPGPKDHRKEHDEQAEAANKLTIEHYAPLGIEGAKNLAKYSEAELRTVTAVLNDSLSLQEDMTRRLLQRHGKA